jgi:hypothetical protein
MYFKIQPMLNITLTKTSLDFKIVIEIKGNIIIIKMWCSPKTHKKKLKARQKRF